MSKSNQRNMGPQGYENLFLLILSKLCTCGQLTELDPQPFFGPDVKVLKTAKPPSFNVILQHFAQFGYTVDCAAVDE